MNEDLMNEGLTPTLFIIVVFDRSDSMGEPFYINSIRDVRLSVQIHYHPNKKQ